MNCNRSEDRMEGSGTTEVRARIRQTVETYPAMPALYQEALACMRDPDMDFEQLARKIQLDPGITINILKVVNSACFAGSEPVRSLQHAMVRLGSRQLSRIIVAQGVSARLAVRLDGYKLEPRSLLRHSIATALTAERLALHLNLVPDKGLFTAGLLHDLGKIFLDPFICEKRAQVEGLLGSTKEPFDRIEKEVLGVTHPEAGAWLMKQWNLPEDIVEMVEFHHEPHRAPRQEMNALLVHLADTLVYSQGIGDGIDGFRYSVENQSAERLGLQSIDVEQVVFDAWESIQEMESLLHVPGQGPVGAERVGTRG